MGVDWPYFGQQKPLMVDVRVILGIKFCMTFSNKNKAKSKKEV
jgi:hypothetical protein